MAPIDQQAIDQRLARKCKHPNSAEIAGNDDGWWTSILDNWSNSRRNQAALARMNSASCSAVMRRSRSSMAAMPSPVATRCPLTSTTPRAGARQACRNRASSCVTVVPASKVAPNTRVSARIRRAPASAGSPLASVTSCPARVNEIFGSAHGTCTTRSLIRSSGNRQPRDLKAQQFGQHAEWPDLFPDEVLDRKRQRDAQPE